MYHKIFIHSSVDGHLSCLHTLALVNSPPMNIEVLQSCLTLCDHMNCSPPVSSVHEDSPGQDIGVGCCYLLQGIFLTQGLNWCLLWLLYGRQILYHWVTGFPQGTHQVVGLLGHMVVFIYSLLRNLYIVLHSGCNNVHFHQQCKSFTFFQTFSRIYCLQIF